MTFSHQRVPTVLALWFRLRFLQPANDMAIDRARFPSARSEALAAELRAEIDRLLADAMRRTARHCAAPSS